MIVLRIFNNLIKKLGHKELKLHIYYLKLNRTKFMILHLTKNNIDFERF